MQTKEIEQLIKQFDNARLVLIANQNSKNKKLTDETLALIENIKLKLLTKLYSVDGNEKIKISELVPQGYEIDKEKSTFENIILKPIEVKLPLHVQYIPNRFFYINSIGTVIRNDNGYQTANSLSTENRAKAFLALMQLVELRDAWNGDWRADWEQVEQDKYCIYFHKNKLDKARIIYGSLVLHFKTLELRDKFAEQFKDLINEAKELL